MARQTKTDIPIPEATQENNQAIIEPLTDQEKEEEYEVNLHISTFTSGDSPKEEKNPLQVENVPTKQYVVTPTIQHIIIPNQQQEKGKESIEEGIQTDSPKYAMTKENLNKIAKEISTSIKKKGNQEKGKGKCKIILSEESEYEE